MWAFLIYPVQFQTKKFEFYDDIVENINIAYNKMGHDLVFSNAEGEQVDCISTKWLRDYAPRHISFDSEYFLKETLTTNDLLKYMEFLADFIEDMELDYPVFPADELLSLKFDSSESAERFQQTLARVISMLEKKADYSQIEKDLEILSEIIQEEEEKHPSWADETTIKFWEFSESLENGLFMMSKKHDVWIEVELYESIQKFIGDLEKAVRNGWTAEWSY